MIAHNWLRGGHSRWYFHCENLQAVRLTVAQPTRLGGLANQRARVALDDQWVVDEPLPAQQERTFTVPCPAPAAAGLHRLDVTAAARVAYHGEVLSLQVLDPPRRVEPLARLAAPRVAPVGGSARMTIGPAVSHPAARRRPR